MAITQYYFRQAKSIGWLRPRAKTATTTHLTRCSFMITGNAGNHKAHTAKIAVVVAICRFLW